MKRTNPAERQALKNMARMGMVPASELSPSNLSAEASLPAPSLDKYAEVKAAVTEIAQGFKAQVKASVASGLRHWIGEWQKKCTEFPGLTAPSDFWGYASNVGRSAYMFNQFVRNTLSPFMTSVNMGFREHQALCEKYPGRSRMDVSQLTYTLKPAAEVDAIIERKSERQAEDAIQSFIAKMTKKLCGILDAKADFVSCRVQGVLSQNTLRFEFADGAGFTVTNDIIINHSYLGTAFNQFPCRFSQVTISGMGKSLNGVSEAWMKRNFKSGPQISFK